MVEITSDEAKYLRERKVLCTKTCRLKRNGRSRGKFYAPEEKYVLELLEDYCKSITIKEIYPVK